MKRTFCLLLLSCCCFAQAAKPIPPVTEKEQLDFLKKQNKALATIQALAALPQYNSAVAAKSDIDAFTAKLYADRKLTQADAALCFGPGPGVCEGVPESTLEFRAVPKSKPEEKKPEAK